MLRHSPSASDDPLVSDYATHSLEFIASHPSKGSRSYYRPWLKQYLRDLQESLFEIGRTVHPSGVICMVVQDSYFKTFHIDLQRIVCETLRSRGRALTCRYDYSASNPRSLYTESGTDCPPKNRNHKETLLVFG